MVTCSKKEFFDQGDYSIPLERALVLRREYRGHGWEGGIFTNVPHLVVEHSPTGFEWGYSGSGPADLALNICQAYLRRIGYEGEKTQCYAGECFSLAFRLHQDFKRDFIALAPRQGITIPMQKIKQWFDGHITDEMKRNYAVPEADE